MKNIRKRSREGGDPSPRRVFFVSSRGAYGIVPPTLVPSRRDEGIFISPTKGCWGAFVYVSSLLEEFAWGEGALSVGGPFVRRGGVFPQFLVPLGASGFPNPEVTHGQGDVKVKRTFFPLDGERTLVIRYRVQVGRAGVFKISPVLGLRTLGEISRERELPLGVRKERSGVFLRYGAAPVPPLTIVAPGAEFEQDFKWLRGIWYSEGGEDGSGVEEDLPSPGALVYPLKEGANTFYLVFSLDGRWEKVVLERPGRAVREVREALKRGRPLCDDLPRVFQKDFNPVKECALRMVFECDGRTVAYTSLPGRRISIYDLVSFLNDFAIDAGLIYQTSSLVRFIVGYMRKGVLPKYLDESGKPIYSSADTSLLFVDAIGRYMGSVTSSAEAERLYGLVKEIVYSYLDGTEPSIKVDSDYLVAAGEEGIEATWMDEVVGGRHLTKRFGKAVDVNALWYSALCVLRDLALYCGDKKVVQEMVRLIPRVKTSFMRSFVLDKEGYLADVVRGGERVKEFRPNQVVAMATKYPVLSPTLGRRVLQRVREKLVTEYGLRTLAPGEPGYRGRVDGDSRAEREAVFSGAVLPRLVVVHARAMLNVAAPTRRVKNQVRKYLMALRILADKSCPAYLPEALHGDPPHEPAGAAVSLASTAALSGLFDLYRHHFVD